MYGIVIILALLPTACVGYMLQYVDITLLLHRSKFALCNASTFLGNNNKSRYSLHSTSSVNVV